MLVHNFKRLYVAIGFIVLVMIANLSYPNVKPFTEGTLWILNIPARSSNGIHILGIFSIILLLIGLYLLATSINKYRVRLVILALVLFSLLPLGLVDLYQKTFASGIFAVDYEQESSNCIFNMVDDKTMLAACELTFINHSNNNFNFDVTFYDEYSDFEPDTMIRLMNEGSPYNVSMRGNETKTVHFNTEIDISKLNGFYSGTVSQVNIQIKQGDKIRYL